MTYNKKLKAIFDKHRYSEQLKKLSEEIFEFQEAVIEFELDESNLSGNPMYNADIMLELADVLVLLNQFMLHYNISVDDLDRVMMYKINRQCKRDGIGEPDDEE